MIFLNRIVNTTSIRYQLFTMVGMGILIMLLLQLVSSVLITNQKVKVVRNDEIELKMINQYDIVFLSPGPGNTGANEHPLGWFPGGYRPFRSLFLWDFSPGSRRHGSAAAAPIGNGL